MKREGIEYAYLMYINARLRVAFRWQARLLQST